MSTKTYVKTGLRSRTSEENEESAPVTKTNDFTHIFGGPF